MADYTSTQLLTTGGDLNVSNVCRSMSTPTPIGNMIERAKIKALGIIFDYVMVTDWPN